MNIKFDIGKFYRRRDGEKVKLVYIGAAEQLLFVYDNISYWCYSDGNFSFGFDSAEDIIGEWSDKKRVKIMIEVEVSEWAKYVGVDYAGNVYQFERKPSMTDDCFDLPSGLELANVINWRETLTEVK